MDKIEAMKGDSKIIIQLFADDPIKLSSFGKTIINTGEQSLSPREEIGFEI